jgi:hypothetical protein
VEKWEFWDKICVHKQFLLKYHNKMRMRWPGHVARMGEKRSSYRLLVGKPEGRTPLGRPRSRWLDNIRMDLIEVG